ncbi:MAG TPA: RNase H family protein, partial [Actinomycetota bacterium]|nr:RNase H family protein [Actinomycetota bacterium]
QAIRRHPEVRVLPADTHTSVVISCDGAARGNPGPAGLGVVLATPDGEVIEELADGLGVATNNVAEYTAAIDAGRTRGAQVGISATVTFTFAPSGDDAFDRARILDGAVTLVRTEEGYRVLDLFRDGIEMTDGIELLRDVSQSQDGVTVTLDSVFMFAPNWQFNVIVENTTSATLVADPGATGLFVGAGEDAAAEAGAVTGSVLTVPASTSIDGILAAPLQETTTDRTLVLTYLAGERTLTFTFPLVDLIDVAPAPGDGATGATGTTA